MSNKIISDTKKIEASCTTNIPYNNQAFKDAVRRASDSISIDTKQGEHLFLETLKGICLSENKSFSLTFVFQGAEHNIAVKKLINKSFEEKTKEQIEKLKRNDFVIESLYDLPEGWIIVAKASVNTGLSRDKIRNLVDSKKIKSIKVKYRNQVRTLIYEESLYELRPKIK